MFVVSFVGSIEKAKDTLRNLLDTNECVINLISEHFVEAANATSVNAPYGVSEFEIAGLHQASSATVKAPRVQESIFSIEGRLVETKEFESSVKPGKKTGVMAIVEGTRFWVREDAINDEKSLIDLEVLRPISRLGGIRYGRTTEIVELARPSF
jgi:flavin reductase (DIM6/NTAB) family NADH-FMN oxidoreductase RutF